MSKGKGNGTGLYLTQTDPSAGPGDITNYDLVGFSKNLSYPSSRNMIDASDKDSDSDSEFEPGRRSRTIDGTFNYDLADGGDTGQGHAKTSFEADSESAAKLYWLITDNVTGNIQHYGEGYCSNHEISYPDEGMAEVSLTIQVTGAVTDQAVTT